MRRTIVSLVAGLAMCLPVDFSGALAPAVSADDLPVESVAQRPRVLRRGSPQPSVRRYRSYAIVPGDVTESAPAGSETVDAVTPSSSQPSFQAPRSSRGSKPSYMRADSKARGQFGR